MSALKKKKIGVGVCVCGNAEVLKRLKYRRLIDIEKGPLLTVMGEQTCASGKRSPWIGL
jgi:hypothetical protein